MENQERRVDEGRRTLDRRKRFNPNYKGWQRRSTQNRRSQKSRRNSV